MFKRDLEYYCGRAITERSMAAAALDPRAIFVHLELAERYEALVIEERVSLIKIAPAIEIAVAA